MGLLSFSQVIMGAETITRAIGARVLRTDVLIYCAIFLFLSFIIWLSNREISASLHHARRSEKSLEHERNTLERRIAERTVELERMKTLEHDAKFGEISRGLLHDLMSPLSSISLYVEQMKDGQHHPKESSAALFRMIDISRRLNSFSENLKHYLGNENGVQKSTTTDVVKELEIMRDILSFKARKARVKLEFHVPHSLIIPVDRIRMHQVISNLMTNALEACETQDHIEQKDMLISVTLTHDTDSIKLSVTDTGCGISQENISHVFKKPFTTKKHGTGNGLMTIQTIVEDEFHGTIVAQSNPRLGTSFVMTIPYMTTSPSLPSQTDTLHPGSSLLQ